MNIQCRINSNYILYSVDLGIPFSLVGQEPIYYNHSHDKNKPSKYKVMIMNMEE